MQWQRLVRSDVYRGYTNYPGVSVIATGRSTAGYTCSGKSGVDYLSILDR